jgi:vacuolar iron transporter family protein
MASGATRWNGLSDRAGGNERPPAMTRNVTPRRTRPRELILRGASLITSERHPLRRQRHADIVVNSASSSAVGFGVVRSPKSGPMPRGGCQSYADGMSEPDPVPAHADEPHDPSLGSRLNWLRAGVLGANDGIVSTAGIVAGVAGATSDRGDILTAGIAGLVAGALSMAAGEYVSVSAQRDTEKSLISKEKDELATMPETELDELAELYERRGLSPPLARQVAEELTAKDPLRAHLDIELGIDPDDLVNPWHAAGASAGSFVVGALLPILAVVLAPDGSRVPVTFVAVVMALALTGLISSQIGQAQTRQLRAIARNVIGGALAMTITYLVGTAVGGLGM